MPKKAKDGYQAFVIGAGSALLCAGVALYGACRWLVPVKVALK